MAATTQTCVTITCDACGAKFEGDFVYHFDTLADARSAADGEQWFVAEDGRALCPAWQVKPGDHLRTGEAWLAALSQGERGDLLLVYPQLGEDYYADADERAEAFGEPVAAGSGASALAERPIEHEDPEPEPQIPHQGALPVGGSAPPLDVRGFRVGDLVRITAREGEGDATPPGLRLNGRTGYVAEIDDSSQYSIGVAIEGWSEPVWCSPAEIRHAARRCRACDGTGVLLILDPRDPEFVGEGPCGACDRTGRVADEAESGSAQ